MALTREQVRIRCETAAKQPTPHPRAYMRGHMIELPANRCRRCGYTVFEIHMNKRACK